MRLDYQRKRLADFDRPEWAALIAQFLRYNAMVGVRPRLPRRLRVAAVIGASPAHMSRRIAPRGCPRAASCARRR